jgi:hypothetical protein
MNTKKKKSGKKHLKFVPLLLLLFFVLCSSVSLASKSFALIIPSGNSYLPVPHAVDFSQDPSASLDNDTNITPTASGQGRNFLPSEQATSAEYFVDLERCFVWATAPDGTIVANYNQNIGPSAWFPTPKQNVVYVDGARTDCASVATKALSLWGWDGTQGRQIKDFLGAIDCNFITTGTSNLGNYKCDGNQDKRSQNFKIAIIQAAYFGVDTHTYNSLTAEGAGNKPTNDSAIPMSGSAYYELYLAAFDNGCSPTDLGTTSGDLLTNNESTGNLTKVNNNYYVFGKEGADHDNYFDTSVYTPIDTVDPTTGKFGTIASPTADGPHGFIYITNTYGGGLSHSGNGYEAILANPPYDSAGSAFESSYINIFGHLGSDGKTFDNEPGGLVTHDTCTDLKNKINKYAPDYATYVAHKITTTKTGDPFTHKDNLCKTDPSASGCTPPADTTCGGNVAGIAWLICPVMTAITGLNDAMWNVIVTNMLNINPINQSINGQSSNIYNAWSAIRNIANVIFVIIFLIMIFSQLTSFGIDNYGIKKLLPRLIIGAILVNVSFVIVQISVDLFNIIGSSLYNLLINLVPVSATPSSGLYDWAALLTGTGFVLGGIALVSVGAGFLMILPAVAVGALGLLAALLTLIVRQAAIPILAIIAPLAFVAYLLPNTESWFKKWRDLLLQMLMLYPLAALIFGGARIAGELIMNTGGWWNHLVGLVVITLPLFSLPFLATKGGAITNAVGKRLQDLAKSAKAPIKKVTDPIAAEKRAERLAGERNLMGFKNVRRRRGEDMDAYREREKSELAARKTAGNRNLAQRFNERVIGRAQNTENLTGQAKEDWRERPLNENLANTSNSNQKAASRAANIINSAESLGNRKAAIDSQYKQQLNERIGTAGSPEQSYDTTRRESTFAVDALTKEADNKFKGSVAASVLDEKNNGITRGSLGDLSRRAFVAGEGIKAADLQAERSIRESGAGSIQIQAQKQAQKGIEAQTEKDTSNFGQRTLTDTDLRGSLLKSTEAKLQTKTNEAKANTFTETTGELLIPRQAAIVAESEYKAAQGKTGQMAAEIATGTEAGKENFANATRAAAAEAGLDLFETGAMVGNANSIAADAQAAQRGIDIATSATNSANNIQKQKLNEDIEKDYTLAQNMAGIDTTNGIPRKQAEARAGMVTERGKNVASAISMFKDLGYNSNDRDQALAKGKLPKVDNNGNIVRDGKGIAEFDPSSPNISSEQREAIIQSTVESGYVPSIAKVIDYLGDPPPGTDPQEIQRLQKSFATMPTKQKSVTGLVKNLLAAGEFVTGSTFNPKDPKDNHKIPTVYAGPNGKKELSPSSEILYTAAKGAKFPPSVIVAMDSEEMKQLHEAITDSAPIDDNERYDHYIKLMGQADLIRTALNDPRINVNLQGAQKDELTSLLEDIDNFALPKTPEAKAKAKAEADAKAKA